MTLGTAPPAHDGAPDRRLHFAVWIASFGALAIWVSNRLGAFALWATVTTSDGERVRFPNGFALVDHPFHAVRAETLRRALVNGEILRWIGHHQGGYPVEFYPLGVAILDLLAWAAALGTLPMMAVHKLVVIFIFLAPVVGYLLIAGFDRSSLGVALLAGAAHVCVRGWWWSGGSMELVEWGLVTNVAAVTALVVALPFAANYLDRGWRRGAAAAGLLCAFALVGNPRSGIAIASLLAGSAVAIVVTRGFSTGIAKQIVYRAVLLGVVAGLLAAPEIVSLIRFNHLYYFVHYSEYENLRAYWDSSIQAVSGPVFVLGIFGFAIAWFPGRHFVTRVVAATLASYVAGTAFLVVGKGPGTLIEQLETTRLMPFQRLLWIYLAAFAVERVLKWLAMPLAVRHRTWTVDLSLVATSALVALLYVISPPSFIPVGDRGLVALPGSAQPGIVDLENAVRVADTEAAPGTAMLVLGSTLSWHDQLWAPLWSDRPMFYDDWLWYWQTRHYGDYDPFTEHAYPRDSSALAPNYLHHHGIGAIVVTGQAKPDARTSPYLTLVRQGTWDVYRVNDPVSIVTIDGAAPDSASIGNQRISATGESTGGEILVRRNWFPRWKATVNGHPAAITETDDGYMSMTAPAGPIELEVIYQVDWIDWLCRVAVVLGIGVIVLLMLPPSVISRARLGHR